MLESKYHSFSIKKKKWVLSASQIKFMNAQQIQLYIKKLHSILIAQDIRLQKFKKKIYNSSLQNCQKKNLKNVKCTNVSTQTEVLKENVPKKEAEIERIEQVSNYVNDIKQAATEGWLKQMGMVYEPTSGLYYQASSGYYYDPTYNLYYDGNTGTYLKYNEESFEYEFYSKAETVQTTSKDNVIKENSKNNKQQDSESDNSTDWYERHKSKRGRRKKSYSPEIRRRRYSRSTSIESNDSYKRRENNKKKKKSSKKSRQSESTSSSSIEDGECSISESSKSDTETKKSSDDKPERFRSKKDIAARYPPSLRLIIQETDLKEKLKTGSLFIIPYTGGTLGREGSHEVIIPDINVSKNHLSFKFNQKKNRYECIDQGSRNGTILNGKRMSESNEKSKQMHLMHDSTIILSKTKILCHIHQGMTTCSKCEPGLNQPNEPESKPSATIEVLSHKDTLKQLKKQYGLEKEKYKEPEDISSSNSTTNKTYKNRAETRRKTVGSSHHNEKTVASSMETSISSENKGFKLLSKLGWSAGQSLGKSEHGLLEPIQITSNEGTKGLGSNVVLPSQIDTLQNKRKVKILQKTRERFENSGQTKITNLDVYQNSSDSSDS